MRKIIIAIMLIVPVVCNAQEVYKFGYADSNYSSIRIGWKYGDTSTCKTTIVLDSKQVLTAKCHSLDSLSITGDTIDIIKYLITAVEQQGNRFMSALNVINMINIKWLTTSNDIENKEWQKELKKQYEAYRKELYGE